MMKIFKKMLISLLSALFFTTLAISAEIVWNNVDVLAENPKLSLSKLQVFDNSEKIYIKITGKEIADRSLICIDSDNNSDTGYHDKTFLQSGTEYLIYNNRLFKSLSNTEWLWEYIADISYNKSDTEILIGLEKALLQNLKETFNIRTANYNEGWITQGYLPADLKMAAYTMKEEKTDVPGSTLSPIQSLIYAASKGTLSNVTYICIGDSTRAQDYYYDGGHIFEEVASTLQYYNVNSILQAKPGYTAIQYYKATASPNWKETMAKIPGNGETTIVDISLGINDARYYSSPASTIKYYISQSIDNILAYKPKTTFMLTMPNKLVGLGTIDYQIKLAYEQLANEKNILLINTMDEIFGSSVDYSLYRIQDAWDYGNNIRIHLSTKGQALVADLILSNILP